MTSDAQSIAYHFNLHFVEVESKLVKKLPSTSNQFEDYLPTATPNSFYFNPTRSKEYYIQYIFELQSKTSSSVDGIPTKVLKSTLDNVIYILTHIFNLSLRSGIFFNEFKLAQLIGYLFSKEEQGMMLTITDLLVCSQFSQKSQEKLVYRRILSFLTIQNFFHENRFGFRKNYSTSHAATFLVENIARLLHLKKKSYFFRSVCFKNKRFLFSAIVKGVVGVDCLCWLLTASVVHVNSSISLVCFYI